MTSLHVAVCPLPLSRNQLYQRLKEISRKVNTNRGNGSINSLKLLPGLEDAKIRDCVIGPKHIGLLFEDGSICRVSYIIHAELLREDCPSRNASHLGSDTKATTSGTTETGGSSRSSTSSRNTASVNVWPSSGVRARVMRRNRDSLLRRPFLASYRNVLPVNLVPDDLIEQVQGVLQDKSRQVIIRELQRSNLDVNVAVNNLLSRDDDDDTGEPEDSTEYTLADEMLSDNASFFDDGGFIFDSDFGDDNLTNNVHIRPSTSRGGSYRQSLRRDPSNTAEREESSKLMRSFDDLSDATSSNNLTDRNIDDISDLVQFNHVQWWLAADNTKEKDFTHIAALHSELIAVNSSGKLFQWKWSDKHPYKGQTDENMRHPRTADLDLKNEVIVLVAANSIRASVATLSGKVATWVDDCVHYFANKIEHPARKFREFEDNPIKSLQVCPLYTCVQLSSDVVMWWGIPPFAVRKKIIEKAKLRLKKAKSSCEPSSITVGSMVRFSGNPIYNHGAIAINISSGKPKIGQLLESAWNMDDKRRFRILPYNFVDADLENDDSHAQFKSESSKRYRDDSEFMEEIWDIKNAIFVEASMEPPVGQVMKIDGGFAIVKVNSRQDDSKSADDGDTQLYLETMLLRSCRLLPLGDLQLTKTPYSCRCVDKIQRVPKLLPPSKGRIVALSANCNGILQVTRSDGKLTYSRFNLDNGRSHTLCTIPTDMIQVEEHKEKATMLSIDQEWNCVLRDSLGALFPLSVVAGQNIKDSDWLNLPPTRSIAVGVNFMERSIHSINNPIALIAMVMDNQKLMSYILESDYRSVRQLLDEVDRISDPESKQNYIKSLLLEHCDGKRNILHMCASMCKATAEEDRRQADQSTPVNPSSSYSGPYLLANLHRSTSFPSSRTDSVDRLISSHMDEDMFVSSRHETISSHRDEISSLLGFMNESSSLPGPSVREGMKSQGSSKTSDYSRREQEMVTSNSFESSKEFNTSAAIKCLSLICKNDALKPYLGLLLLTRDAHGYTPFMLAVHLRAYKAALILFDLAKELAEKQDDSKEVLRQIICPSETTTDCSPIYNICLNDCCSFTWTGTEHINQDVYECRTCGLVDTHCCCTECALICHKGHNCVLKSSPSSAYCDCLEKCNCQIQVAGSQGDRLRLLQRLIAETDLVRLPNERGEHILLFVLHTAVRQANSHHQFRNRPHDRRLRHSKSLRSLSGTVVNKDMGPLLEPPKFAAKALELLLQDWTSVMSLIMPEAVNVIFDEGTKMNKPHSTDYPFLARDEQKAFLSSQDNSVRLDCFTYYLIVKYNTNECKALEHLLRTIIKSIENPITTVEAEIVAKRFVRSVARIFVVLSATPDAANVFRIPLRKCRSVFQSLHIFAVTELAKAADSLIAPVRLGIAQPAWLTVLTSHVDAAQFIENLFVTEPFTEGSTAGGSRTDGNDTSNPSFNDSLNNDQHASQEIRDPVIEIDHANIRSDADNTERRNTHDLTSSVSNDTLASRAPMAVEELIDTDSDASSPHEQSRELSRSADIANEGIQVDNSSNNESEMDLGMLEEIDSDSSDSVVLRIESASATTSRMHVQNDIDSNMVYYSDEEDESSSSEAFEEPDELPGRPQSRRMMRGNTDAPIYNISRSIREPHVLQWAVNATAHPQQGGHIITPNSILYPDSIRTGNSGNSNNSNRDSISSIANSNSSYIAKMFAVTVREVTDLLVTLTNLKKTKCIKSRSNTILPVDEVNLVDLQEKVKGCLSQSWRWIVDVMDNTESQLRFGVSLLLATDKKHPMHPLNPDYQQKLIASSRRDRASNRDTGHLWESSYRRARLEASNLFASSRHDVLIYALSLMRSNNYEHRDTIPFMDISSMKHVAYVFDAIMYFLRHDIRSLSTEDENNTRVSYEVSNRTSSSGATINVKEVSDTSKVYESRVRKNKRFFRRTNSTLHLGSEPADPFKTPMNIALPLAEKPHLLSPSVLKQDLFSSSIDTRDCFNSNRSVSVDLNLSTRLQNQHGDCGTDFNEMKPECWLGRWKLTVELFSRAFMEDIGCQPDSILTELVSFDIKEAAFRREMEKHKNLQTRDLVIEVERDGAAMIKQTVISLNDFYKKHQTLDQPLAVHRVKASFKNEPGEGSGVARSFYSGIAEAFLSNEKLPVLNAGSSSSRDVNLGNDRRRGRNYFVSTNRIRDVQSYPLSYDAPSFDPTKYSHLESVIYNSSEKQVLGKRLFEKIRAFHPEHAAKITGMLLEHAPTQNLLALFSDENYLRQRIDEAISIICSHQSETEDNSSHQNSKDNEPLFYQPGKVGFYSPRPGSNSLTRLNLFRNIGRIIGLCLLQNEVSTLTFNRHVLKVLLNRDVQWHDLAFFNASLYENLRQLIMAGNKDNAEQYFKEMDLRFVINLSQEEGGKEVELIEGGSGISVTPENVYEYVELYAMQKMYFCMQKPLDAMRKGIFDVIPQNAFKNLNTEDLRLLLNGIGEVDVKWVKRHTSFNDESKGSSGNVERLKRWFWSIFEKMSTEEKRELLYFWTSSPALPVSGEGFQPLPTITIRPSDDQHLPTANTCISRLYLPLYSSKAILKSKLLMAIKIKVFGFV
ncbi:E3 ubiquitin-protein ligase UBR5 [Trichoplax sp. H2]|nr:E3 ubiquitin-protein ligase UBR5 [Trichoplax sp. H2]|eukprot:RDD37597.1 E3 ubiquitin-protein ligase UBR5 [Trichoplax sp. H2]